LALNRRKRNTMRGEDVPSFKGGRKNKEQTAQVKDREKTNSGKTLVKEKEKIHKKTALVKAAVTLLYDSEILVRFPEFLPSLARPTLTQSAHVMKFSN